ncbi:hypothetical protein TCAL_17042 [Tigriopus californicus]|uniref:Uncharacterized protein n=1 Tax=Tigriopus californicus TaxID=6832 RepID=A0A553PNH2_TIGCA|nr:hypothetical protein TCAL_17042 [Tigriopus californicus]
MIAESVGLGHVPESRHHLNQALDLAVAEAKSRCGKCISNRGIGFGIVFGPTHSKSEFRNQPWSQDNSKKSLAGQIGLAFYWSSIHPLARQYHHQQLELALAKPKSRRYSASLLASASMWQIPSPALYKQFLSERILSLPGLTTIKRLSSNLSLNEVESPELKIAQLDAALQAKDLALQAKDAALQAKDAAIEEMKKSNKQLCEEMACVKLADKLKETLSLATRGNEDPKQLARQMTEKIDEAKDYRARQQKQIISDDSMKQINVGGSNLQFYYLQG